MTLWSAPDRGSHAVFVFTRDAPSRIAGALQALPRLCPTYVIDDSIHAPYQASISAECAAMSARYIGRMQYQEFLARSGIDEAAYPFLLREPGSSGWNLGYMRNLALLFAYWKGYERVLFVDDDIRGATHDLIVALMARLDKTSFVGAQITGQLDDSILGHIAADLGVHNPELLSGGFLAFRPLEASSYFFNVYDEDWIWLLLQLLGRTFARHGKVVQLANDGAANFETTLLFQEYGELLVDGLLAAKDAASYDALTSADFWNRMRCERAQYLDELLARAVEQRMPQHAAKVVYLKAHLPPITTEHLSQRFVDYWRDLKLFQALLLRFTTR